MDHEVDQWAVWAKSMRSMERVSNNICSFVVSLMGACNYKTWVFVKSQCGSMGLSTCVCRYAMALADS